MLLLILAAIFLMIRKTGSAKLKAEDMAASALADGTAAAGLPDRTPVQSRLEKEMADNEAEQALIEAETIGHIKLAANTRKSEVLVRHIRESIKTDPANAANILRTWVTDTEARRT
jgi:flagellar biosynthesis/type III secretory pathway M-ring protein FliF/YscJ